MWPPRLCCQLFHASLRFAASGLREAGVFFAHYGENREPWMAPNSSPAFVKRLQLCLISGVRPPRTDGSVWTPQGLKGEDRASLDSKSTTPPSQPPPLILLSFSPPPATQLWRSSPSPSSLPRGAWGGRGERSRLRESFAQIPRDLPAAAAAASYVFPFDKSPLLQQK